MHREELETSTVCACFYCLSQFKAEEIEEWVDWPKDLPEEDWTEKNGSTAICPRCGVDSVLGDKSGYPLTEEFLGAMHKLWFS